MPAHAQYAISSASQVLSLRDPCGTARLRLRGDANSPDTEDHEEDDFVKTSLHLTSYLAVLVGVLPEADARYAGDDMYQKLR